jgi:hypothetical protein
MSDFVLKFGYYTKFIFRNCGCGEYIVISNFKSYVLGTYHGISDRYVQEYLDEFCYRLNRRFWENQIPNRLLKLCATHPPVLRQPVAC